MVPLLLESWIKAADIRGFLLFTSVLALIGVTAQLKILVLFSVWCKAGNAVSCTDGSTLSQAIVYMHSGRCFS